MQSWSYLQKSNRKISAATKILKTQRMYACPLVHGALGIGKTRIVTEFNKSIGNRLSAYGGDYNTASIYMDFSRGDSIQPGESSMLNILGLRLASHFFFGRSSAWLISELGLLQCAQAFPFLKVISLISSKFCTDKPLVLTIQLDEFGFVSADLLNELMRIIATQMSANQQSSVVVTIPYWDYC